MERKDTHYNIMNWFQASKERDGLKLIKELMSEKTHREVKEKYDDNSYSWANWFVIQIMNKEQYIKYAVFSAEQVIKIYEKKYPEDSRPRLAVEAAKKWVEKSTKENKATLAAAWDVSAFEAAFEAARDAFHAAEAASKSGVAARAAEAAWAAGVAFEGAEAIAWAAEAAFEVAWAALEDVKAASKTGAAATGDAEAAWTISTASAARAAWAAAGARAGMQFEILDYGIRLLEAKQEKKGFWKRLFSK